MDPYHRRTVRRCIAIVAAAMLAGCRHCAPQPPPDSPADRDEAYRQIRLLTRAMAQIRRDYVDEEKTDYQTLTYGALRGMLQSLDPHSQFMDADSFEDMKDDTAGQFGGLGIVVGLRDALLTVIAPMEDTPAHKAGVMPGDKIIEIDGKSTENLSLNDAIKKLRGEPGTKVQLRLLRPKTQEIKTLTMTRAEIKVQSVKDAHILEDGIGYLRIVLAEYGGAGTLEATGPPSHPTSNSE